MSYLLIKNLTRDAWDLSLGCWTGSWSLPEVVMGAAAPFSWHSLKGLCGSGGRGQVELGMSTGLRPCGWYRSQIPRAVGSACLGKQGEAQEYGCDDIECFSQAPPSSVEAPRTPECEEGSVGDMRFLWVPL